MSRFWSAADAGDARTVALTGYSAAAASATGGFRALFADGTAAAFHAQGSRATEPEQEPEPVDPIDQAHAEGFAMGFQEGTRIAQEAAADDHSARDRIAQALEQLSPASSGTLATMLSAAVVRLVEQIVGQVEVDTGLLRERCEAVAAFIDGGESAGALHVHPSDLAYIQHVDIAVPVVPDAQMRRGCVRLDTAEGWIEDGPDVRLSRLKAMLDDMEGRS